MQHDHTAPVADEKGEPVLLKPIRVIVWSGGFPPDDPDERAGPSNAAVVPDDGHHAADSWASQRALESASKEVAA